MKGRSRLYPISIIMMAAFLAAGPANAVYAAEPNGSWVNLDGNWYWKKKDGTAYIGWLYTGDLAVMDEEGYFFIMDRKKDMVIVGGYNVYPREVDEVLLEHPDVLEGVSVGIPDGVRGEALKAYIVPRPGVELTKADIVGWCRQRLASYKVPRLVEFREELPKTIVGKVLRRALREEEMAKQAKKAARHAARQDGAATAKED